MTKSLHLDGVADREDVRVAGAHLLVDADPAELPDFDPGHPRQRGIRSHAEREDHDVRRIALARLRRHGQGVVVGLLEAGDAVAQRDVHTMLLEEVADEPPVLRVERGEDLIGHLHHRHVEPAENQVLGRLQADEPAADDDRAHRRAHRLEARVLPHPGQEARAALDPFTDLPRVRHGPDREDAGKVDAGQRRADRSRPGDSTSLS